MKKKYEDPEMNVTRFEYEEIMDTSMVGGESPDTGDEFED